MPVMTVSGRMGAFYVDRCVSEAGFRYFAEFALD